MSSVGDRRRFAWPLIADAALRHPALHWMRRQPKAKPQTEGSAVTHLDTPLDIATLHARNRIVRAATYRGLADDAGQPTPDLIAVCEELARGGVGTIVTGYTRILPDEQANPRMLGAYSDEVAASLASLADVAHEHGARIVAQLAHGGSAAKPSEVNRRIVGPSAVENPKSGIVPEAATASDIERTVAAFAAAAARAKAAGFDGVEIHAGHGYLLSQFLSPALNRRDDEYGGSIENRARIVCDVVRAVRAACGNLPLVVKMNSSDGQAGGLSEDDALAAARLAAAAGANAIEVTGAWRAFSADDVRARAGEPFFAAFAQRLAAALRHDADAAGTHPAEVILTGGVRDAGVAEGLVREGGIAAVGMARPLICEPDLPLRWQSDPTYRPRCISCNGCSRSSGCRCVRA